MKKIAILLALILLAGCAAISTGQKNFEEPLYRRKHGYHYDQSMPMYYERETIRRSEYRILPQYIQDSYEVALQPIENTP